MSAPNFSKNKRKKCPTHVPLDHLLGALYLRHAEFLLELLDGAVHGDRLEFLDVHDAPELGYHHFLTLPVHLTDLRLERLPVLDQLNVLLLGLPAD